MSEPTELNAGQTLRKEFAHPSQPNERRVGGAALGGSAVLQRLRAGARSKGIVMHKLLLVSAIALLAAAPSQAKTHHHHAAALKWMDGPPGLPAGGKFAVVSGDPGKAGAFTVQIKMPANYLVPPHHHPTGEVVKVLSGMLHYGMSDKVAMGEAKTLRAGHTVTMKAQMNHWVHAPAPATIQVSGEGPFQIVYVDPKDDPRTK
jgi:quercetin dioxygenase-like cupin family protein